jgi:hypothetical protein
MEQQNYKILDTTFTQTIKSASSVFLEEELKNRIENVSDALSQVKTTNTIHVTQSDQEPKGSFYLLY